MTAGIDLAARLRVEIPGQPGGNPASPTLRNVMDVPARTGAWRLRSSPSSLAGHTDWTDLQLTTEEPRRPRRVWFRATKDGSRHANSRHRRSRLRRLNPRSTPLGTRAPRPRAGQPQVRRSRALTLLPESILRAGAGRCLRPRRRQVGRGWHGGDHSPRRHRRLSRLQEGAPARASGQRRRHQEPAPVPQSRHQVPVRLHRQHLRVHS